MAKTEQLTLTETYLFQVEYLTKVKYEVFKLSNHKYQVEVTIYTVVGAPSIKTLCSFIVESQNGKPNYKEEIDKHFNKHVSALNGTMN
ncbi:hypothetical protein ACUIJ3_10245 [Enterobacter cloacae]|uniref:hypothetical protein n=1 Tax=Enterobacter cloacae TaxID=550 RepID=UPI0040434C1F